MKSEMLIGEVCKQAQCSPRTVRHYEDQRLVSYVAKTPGGHKLYDIETVSIIRTAQLLKRLGYSLKDMRKIMTLTKSSDTRSRRLTQKLRKMLSDAVSRMDSELELLSGSRKKISDLLEETKKCDVCESSDCGACGKLKSLRTLGILDGQSGQRVFV